MILLRVRDNKFDYMYISFNQIILLDFFHLTFRVVVVVIVIV